MHPPISESDLVTLLDEADAAATRLWRRVRLPRADLDDLRQDLLLDLIRRLPAFDARRGSIGAFAGIVLRNQASRIATRLRRERRATGGDLLSLDAAGGDGRTSPTGSPRKTGSPPGTATASAPSRRRIAGSIWPEPSVRSKRATSRSAPPWRSARSAASSAGASARARPSTAASATSAACSPPMARGRRETVRERVSRSRARRSYR